MKWATSLALVTMTHLATVAHPVQAQTEQVPAYAGPLAGEYIDGELVVGFASTASEAQVNRALARSNVNTADGNHTPTARVVKLEPGQSMSSAIESLRNQPGVHFVEPNYI